MEGEELKMEIEGGRRSKVEGDANTKVLELLKNEILENVRTQLVDFEPPKIEADTACTACDFTKIEKVVSTP